MHTRTCIVIASAALLLVRGIAATEPPPDAAPPSGDLLRGPVVPDDRVRTLVNVDATGNLVRLQERPEEAALGLLVMEPEQRERAREVAARRRHALGMLLLENVDLVREATDAIAAGNNEAARAIQLQLYEQFEPDHARDPLLDDFAEILSAEQVDEMKRLVDEYWDAWIERETRNAGSDADVARRRAVRRFSYALFQQELREAYEWTLRPFRTRLEALYEITEPTEEQRALLRDAVIEYIKASRLEPTGVQRRELAVRIHGILDEEQRMQVFERAITDLGSG